MNIHSVLESLSRKRPIYHNEADFQHALAWEIREHYDCKIRLEKRMDIDASRRTYLDILVELDGRRIALELKYKMRSYECTYDGEVFSLLNQGAQDNGRYDVLKDIQRLEQMVSLNLVDEGYLIYLTNDASYYSDPGSEKSTADRDFRIHEGRILTGRLTWGENTGEGTMRGREEPIVLTGEYKMQWQLFSQLEPTSTGTIQSLVIDVRGQRHHDLHAIIQSMDNIPVSQFDLRDKLSAILRATGYNVDINRNLGRNKVDIWAEKGYAEIAIEVRFKTAQLKTTYNGSEIELKNHAAQDISRYDYIRDLEKLESVVAQRPGTRGYAVLITNDRNYWEKPTKHNAVDQDFRIYQGKVVHGVLSWKGASDGTMENRVEPISISGHYRLDWQPYLMIGEGKNEVFKMLIVEV